MNKSFQKVKTYYILTFELGFFKTQLSFDLKKKYIAQFSSEGNSK
jgi:hypothetical protein